MIRTCKNGDFIGISWDFMDMLEGFHGIDMVSDGLMELNDCVHVMAFCCQQSSNTANLGH